MPSLRVVKGPAVVIPGPWQKSCVFCKYNCIDLISRVERKESWNEVGILSCCFTDNHLQCCIVRLTEKVLSHISTFVRTVCFCFYQIIRSRLFPNKAALLPVWNSFPGALVALPHYSRDPKDFPFYHINFETSSEKFTAVIHTTTTVVRDSTSLFRLIKSVGQSSFVSKVKLNSWCQYQIPVCILPCPSSGLSEWMPISFMLTVWFLALVTNYWFYFAVGCGLVDVRCSHIS